MTRRQDPKLAWMDKVNARLYLLKEQFRQIIAVQRRTPGAPHAAVARIPAFIEVGRRMRKNLAVIEATLTHGLSNALVGVDQQQAPTPGPDRLRVQGARAPHRLGPARLRGDCPPVPRRGVPRDRSRSNPLPLNNRRAHSPNPGPRLTGEPLAPCTRVKGLRSASQMALVHAPCSGTNSPMQ